MNFNKHNIPIIVICYNNYKYVENTLKQINNININYYKNILILNNCSTCQDTINYLKTVNCLVINNKNNIGPWISKDYNSDLYNILPEKFIITDPDLEFNKNLPNNFIDILVQLSDNYKIFKIGFSLDISDNDKMFQSNEYFLDKSIYETEITYWKNKIENNNYELYNAPIDTTFCLINKLFVEKNNHIRIAGNFTAKHIPWYIDNKIFNIYENYILNESQTTISTIKKIILDYINNYYIKTSKNNEIFFIKKENNSNINFWQNNFINWENETFEIFDKFLDKNKIIIDIGAWIGTTSLYCSRKSKHVYCIEADKQSVEDLSENLKNNCINNYTIINKAIFDIDNIFVNFGKNIFINDSKLNDSTSQICNININSNEHYQVKTITIENIIKDYNINTNEISLIKVDIEGGEENILKQLYNIHLIYNIPIYISFHYDWWNDKNLDRFEFLTEDNKNYIKLNHFGSILFNK
jgi:FkbM family methyltransferase